MSKEQWIADHERILEDYQDYKIDKEAALSGLQDLGFTLKEAILELPETEKEEEARVTAQMHLADARQAYRDMKGGY